MSYVIGILILISLLGFGASLVSAKQLDTTKSEFINDDWKLVEETAALISAGNTDVANAINFAKTDENILNEHSTFYIKAREEFGRYFNEWVNEDLERKQVPAAVFKTVSYGAGYMVYLDWKNITSPSETMASLNRVLRTLNEPEVSMQVIIDLEKDLKQKNNSSEIASVVVSALNKEAFKRNLSLAWFDENGDSYSFFVVSTDTLSKLTGRVLDADHKFVKAPKF